MTGTTHKPVIAPGQQPPAWFLGSFLIERYWDGNEWGMTRDAFLAWSQGRKPPDPAPLEGPGWFVDTARTRRLREAGRKTSVVRYWSGQQWHGYGMEVGHIPTDDPFALASQGKRLHLIGAALVASAVLIPVAVLLWGPLVIPGLAIFPVIGYFRYLEGSRRTALSRDGLDMGVVGIRPRITQSTRRIIMAVAALLWPVLVVSSTWWIVEHATVGNLPTVLVDGRFISPSDEPFTQADVGKCWRTGPAFGVMVPTDCNHNLVQYQSTALVTSSKQCDGDYLANKWNQYLCIEMINPPGSPNAS